MKGLFARDWAALAQVFAFLDEFAAAHQLDEPVRYTVALAVEELFTNMVKYHGDGAPEIPLHAEVVDGAVRIVLEDHDVERFDITEVPARDIDKPAPQRRPGGLGIHLVREMMDDFRYDYKDRCGTITIVKRLE